MAKKGKAQVYFEYAAARALLSGLGALPRPLAVAAGRAVGHAAYALAGGLRRTGLRNLELALPELDESGRKRILRGSFVSLGRQLGEVSQFPRTRASSSPSSAISPARPQASPRSRFAPTPRSSPSARRGTSGAGSLSSAAAPSSNSSARVTTSATSRSTPRASPPPSNATSECSPISGSGFTSVGRRDRPASLTSTSVRKIFVRKAASRKFLHRRQLRRYQKLSSVIFRNHFNLTDSKVYAFPSRLSQNCGESCIFFLTVHEKYV